MVDFVVLVVGLEENSLLWPDERPGGLEIEIGLGAELVGCLGCADGAVDELFDGVGSLGDFS